ncbi:MAG: hypothetical protein WB783_12285 [Arenicellales bacterium]
MFRAFRYLLLCGVLAVGGLSAVELSNRLDDQSWVLPVDPVAEAHKLAAQHRWAEVKMLARFVQNNPRLGDARTAAELDRNADLELNSFWGRARSFAHGAVTGMPTDGASMLGSLSLDLFAVGDVRDLAVQGWRQMRYGTGDTVIMALSAIGLSMTLAPEVDWAPALMKALKRTGALSHGFLRTLKNASRTALKTGRFEGVSRIVTDVGRTARRLGPGPLQGVMREVDSAEDLSKIAKASKTNATDTYAIVRLFGKNGVKRISRSGKNVTKLVTMMKTGSRLSKIARKSLGVLPESWLVIVTAVCALILVTSLWPRRRRGRRRIPAYERIEPSLAALASSSGTGANR